jgi:GH25 family lysozyme M1 (1,4-beta-N-acetylmuramidase)
VLVLLPLVLATATAAAGASTTLAAASPPARAAAAPLVSDATSGYLEGIDVSHWQGSIDWARVAGAGKAFAIIKASESTDYADPLYATNRSGAQAAGLWTGAYHFARPDATTGDAVGEADHFVSTVGLGRGDLIPALDLEQSGGLSVAALQSWVAAWLGEVTTRLGVRPMIYTSPAFWKKYMGDSSALADAGYKTLWIAHWGVTAPTVPANNWGGRGWTFWQYSNCGTVPGISGCVDLDRYHGTDLLPQAYSIFSLSAATAGQVKQGAEGAAAATVAIARTNFPSEVALAVQGLPTGTSAAFNASPTTATSSSLAITAASGTPTGTYPLTITGSGGGLTRTTRVSLVVADGIPPTIMVPTMALEAGGTVGTSTVPVLTRWSGSDPSGIAGYGLQRSIDGGKTWATAVTSTTATSLWQSLPAGTLAVQRLRATDGLGNTTAWLSGPKASVLMTGQSGSAIHYTGTWRTQVTTSALGGNYLYSTSAGATVTYSFTGSSIGWVATIGPNRGSARIYVDGVYLRTISLYAARYHFRHVVWTRNWAAAVPHTLKIVVVGTAGHPVVDVDGFTRLWRS